MRTSIEKFRSCRQLITQIDGHYDGLSYPGGLTILVVDEKWPPSVRSEGSYYLQIANMEYVGNDLLTMERTLYDFGVAEDLFH